jgi:hypothetical protein
MAAYNYTAGSEGAVQGGLTGVGTTGSLKAFVSSAFADNAEADAFVEAVSPLVYHITSSHVVHMIVDGHAHDAASLTAKAAAIAAGETVTEAAASMIIT